MEKQRLVSIVIGLVIGFGTGISAGALMFNGEPAAINIISIKDNQEVHSIVWIDAVYDKGDELGLWINDVMPDDFSVFPYGWNNMECPVGTYEIKVGVSKNDNWEYDTTSVVIAEEFVVPLNYNFTEGFVVHEGQTVIFENGTWNMYGRLVQNGINTDNLKEWHPINNFGTLIIKNASVYCDTYEGWSGSNLNLNAGGLYIAPRLIEDSNGYDAYNYPIFRTGATYTLTNGGMIYEHNGNDYSGLL